MSIHEMVKTQKWYYVCNMRSAYFPIDRRLCREREQERERLYPSVKQWKHRNGTVYIIWHLHISLLIGDCVCVERERQTDRESKREREAMSICEMVKTQKWYYLHNTRSACFPIDRGLHREKEQEGEVMSNHEIVKKQKWYYLHNTRSAYFPISRRLHRGRGYVHPWNGENTEMVLSP